MKTNVETVADYISSVDADLQKRLLLLQKHILKTVKPLQESISYGMPAYKYKGKPLIYFAGYKNHIGIYALPYTHKYFAEQLVGYKQGKGSVQLPNNEPLPLALITDMMLFRKKEIDAAEL